MCRGIARQRTVDEAGMHSSARMSRRYLSAIVKSQKWKDEVHEEEGGNDLIGPRPLDGRKIMEEETVKLISSINGISGISEGGKAAWDDVTGADLDLKKVREARQEEMCFSKR